MGYLWIVDESSTFTIRREVSGSSIFEAFDNCLQRTDISGTYKFISETPTVLPEPL